MAILTSVPAVQFTDTGLVLPQESEILAGVFNDIDTAFGGGVNKALTTPQGQLATSLSAIIADKNEQIALLTNQVNPDYADGVFQDAIGRIYFLERKPATPTIVMCQCVGAVGTQIPIGARALDTSGNIYFCFAGGTIPAGGMIELEFHAQQTGPIPCLAGTLTSIFQMIPGWDTINNEQAGITGTDVEGRADFELRRRASVAINAQGSAAAIYANVFNVDEVIDCFVTENPSGTATTLGATNYPLVPHSVYVAAVGGDDEAIAMAIWNKKNLGCDMNGNTTVIVHDISFAPPYPEYTVKFERPEPLPIKFAVNLVHKDVLPSNIIEQVQAAIMSAFAGGDGGERARIGRTIFASRFYAPVSLIGNAVAIVSIFIGAATASALSVDVGIDQIPTVQPSDITVSLV